MKYHYLALSIALVAIACAMPVTGASIEKIVYESGGQIVVIHPDGTCRIVLTDGTDASSPVWSPDGSKIAFDQGPYGDREIYVMNADGTGRTRLTTLPGEDGSPTWSPDGSKIAFLHTWDERPYSEEAVNEIHVMNADGTGERALGIWGKIIEDLAWSPDSSRIAYASGTGEPFYQKVEVRDIITGESQWIDKWGRHPSWSPDGSWIAYEYDSLHQDRDRAGGIWVASADGTARTALSTDVQNRDDCEPAWSPDGSRIAFVSDRDGSREIYVMNADGTGQTRLTVNSDYISSPAWSPDGTRIAFQHSLNGNYGISIVRAGGGGETRLADSAGQFDWWAGVDTAPKVTGIVVPPGPVAVGKVVRIGGVFADPDAGDTHTASWAWDDGTVTPGTVQGRTVAGSHAYAAPGLYRVRLTVTDRAGAAGSTVAQEFIVVYDRTGVSVAGGGWITSPPGALGTHPRAAGKATFQFEARYPARGTVPTGTAEFRLKSAGLTFRSTRYDWLGVVGAEAQVYGSGTVNGAGGYMFRLTAVDGESLRSKRPDLFRIRIWKRATGTVVYDSQMGAADDADPTTAIGGGSIAVHRR